MNGFRQFRSLARHPTGLRPGTRNTLIVVGVFLAGFALIVGLGDFIGSPTDRGLAEALAIGG